MMIKCAKCDKPMSTSFEELTAAKYYCKECRAGKPDKIADMLEDGFNYRTRGHNEDYG